MFMVIWIKKIFESIKMMYFLKNYTFGQLFGKLEIESSLRYTYTNILI